MPDTRTRAANLGDIVDFSKKNNMKKWNDLISTRPARTIKNSACGMVRNLEPMNGFFIDCPDKRGWSHIYMAAKKMNYKITIVRAEEEGVLGYWILRTE